VTGRDLGLGVRQGERRYALDSLVAQDPPAGMAWLCAECRRQAQIHWSQPLAWRPVTDDCSERADRMAGLLKGFAHKAAERSRLADVRAQ
jgi:hypothetical protein